MSFPKPFVVVNHSDSDTDSDTGSDSSLTSTDEDVVTHVLEHSRGPSVSDMMTMLSQEVSSRKLNSNNEEAKKQFAKQLANLSHDEIIRRSPPKRTSPEPGQQPELPRTPVAAQISTPTPSAPVGVGIRPIAMDRDTSVKCRVDLVVKLGGAAISDKSSFESLNNENLASCVEDLVAAIDADTRAIVVHGAGSFGHPQATKHKLADGFKKTDGDYQQKCLGLAEVHLSVATLNTHIVKALIAEGLPAIGVSPISFFSGTSYEAGVCHLMAFLDTLLGQGYVPVVHGDMIFDASNGCRILGGDTLMVEASKAFRPPQCVFITDVDGVFDKDPRSESNATLISEVEADADGTITLDAVLASNSDSTGGIAAKLKCCGVIANQTSAQGRPVRVFIVKANTKYCLQALLGKNPRVGTRVIPKA